MGFAEWIIAIASVVTGVATGVIAWFAVVSHRLAESNRKLTEELARTSQEMEQRNIQALQHVAAASLAGGSVGGSVPDGVNWFKKYLQQIQELAAQSEGGN